MKNIFLAITLVFAMATGANAQYFSGERDTFFSDWKDIDNGLDRTEEGLPEIPGSHGMTDDQEAPLGGGLLILTALGAGYAVSKRRKK